MTGTLIAQSLVNGVVLGMTYVLVALGFTLIFGIMRMVNFAHGEFYMLGAFVTFFAFAQFQIPFIVSLAIAAIIIGCFGMLIERVIFRPFRGNELNGMIAALGLAIIIQNAALIMWGADPKPMPSVATGILKLGPLIFPWSRLYVIGAAAVIIALFYVVITHTSLGRAMRAVAQDTEIALVQGIRAERIYPFAFGLSVALAALAGGLMGPVFGVSPTVGLAPMLKAFIVVIIGGLGSIPGALLGGLLLGIVESFASTFLGATVSDFLLLALVMLVLIFRPWGLMGVREA
ncbi:branched-chain amino acid ABC transporter permease [Agaricicola taiwanensis]|uniref:Branched-chain amino acid ABC transporter permease n=1 Tax=Agaricicola taiwanensis TaxID=591372 RepID=A0A8J2VN35_9RHOB|nr:branched-chain amino acid ABC transporter permease [Agaricicola taiwanensis]GGE34510.1 branched-chain amino acid ABC transporter permease [Agaricicola taiwanensis]